ncbi:MAG: sulfurtransferase TusA family protein [Rikenellaceae bacterium]|nr:sulfurtransferase TusA family protein [Rikenellaceae bacterium]
MIVPFLHGNLNIADDSYSTALKELLNLLASIGGDTLRFTVRQNIRLRNIPQEAIYDIYIHLIRINPDVRYSLLTNNIVSCTGADTCRLGICLSKGLASAIRRKLMKENTDTDNISDFRIQISGCPNSCGQQVWADLGFSGKALRTSRLYPAYQVYAGAQRGKDPALAETLGSLNARDIPEFVLRVVQDFSAKKEIYVDFRAYLDSEGREFIKNYLDSHQQIPDFEEDKNYYYDWGADNPFSVAERGVGECSAGIFDMIDVDKQKIEQYRKDLSATEGVRRGEILRSIVLHASRMLLVTRGAEPNTEQETFDSFRRLFIDDGLVDSRFSEIVENAKAGRTEFLSDHENIVHGLADAVYELYDNMDDSLQFRNIKKNTEPTAPKPQEEPGVFKDLRGVACPMNFVQTKILLSGMKPEETLEILLDDGQPIANVPGSVRSEGHEVLSQEMQNGYWKVLIKKK